jgi:tol-pal system protein YbgF
MTRAVASLAVIAVVATGCASRGELRQLRTELLQVRSELIQLRGELNGTRAAQESPVRDIARANADLQGLDTRTRDLASAVRETTDEVARLGARLGVTEEAVRATRARVETLATPPPAPPVPAPTPARTPAPASPSRPSPAPPRAQPAAPPPPAPPPASTAAQRPVIPPTDRPARELQEARATGAEKAYAAALATFRAREHGQAVLDLLDFLSRYPKHPLVGAAQYWIGEAYFVQHDYRQALVEFQKVLELGHGKQPEALVKIGLCLLNLRDPDRARQTWQRVARDYPQSEAAATARALLRTHAAARR